MAPESLKIGELPPLTDARMVVGFSGWMDGGDVSTGTVDYLVQRLGAKRFADIEPSRFYVYNIPGSMEVTGLFRPHARIEHGLVAAYQEPVSAFYCAAEQNLVLFQGKEPNLNWREYADCIVSLAESCGVGLMCFIGSVAGIVPHTREPRFVGSVSDDTLKPVLTRHGMRPLNYEGPSSIVTYLLDLARRRGLRMASIVAEVPAYVEGRNVRCIGASVRQVASVLDVTVDVDDLAAESAGFLERIDRIVADRKDLTELIRKLEAEYDREQREHSDARTQDVRAWFERQGFRLN